MNAHDNVTVLRMLEVNADVQLADLPINTEGQHAKICYQILTYF